MTHANEQQRMRAARASRNAGYNDATSQPCLDMQLAHGVRPGKDWGTLPLREQRRWTRLDCDQYVN